MKKIIVTFMLFMLATEYPMLYAASKNSSLTDLLGEGDYSSRKQTIVKIGKQFAASTSQERRNILSTLRTILEIEPDLRKKTDTIILLGSLAHGSLSRDETQQVEETLYKTIAMEQDATVILFAARALPGLGGQDKSVDALSSILARKELLKQEPKLITVTLLSLGRLGQPAIPLLVNALSDFPEKAMLALAATREQKALQILSGLRKSDNPDYRIHAVNALAFWRASKDIAPEERGILDRELSAATGDKDESVRGTALEKLRELKE
jgi:hypothetical protein